MENYFYKKKLSITIELYLKKLHYFFSEESCYYFNLKIFNYQLILHIIKQI